KNMKIWLESAEQIIQEKNRVFTELEKMKSIDPVPSHANFILFEVQGLGAKDVFRELFDGGVLVRSFDSERLESMMRVTIGTPVENDAFLHILRDVIGRSRDEGGTL
ncbi:aminotransferase class I/II-fold pyridoxal phosphate-dependent enzyme, partial [Acidobacteriota bacterium]